MEEGVGSRGRVDGVEGGDQWEGPQLLPLLSRHFLPPTSSFSLHRFPLPFPSLLFLPIFPSPFPHLLSAVLALLFPKNFFYAVNFFCRSEMSRMLSLKKTQNQKVCPPPSSFSKDFFTNRTVKALQEKSFGTTRATTL